MARALLLLAVVWVLHAEPAAAAGRSVPFGWLGVTVDGPVRADESGEWRRMARSGVESVRIAIRWSEMQPLGPDVPTDFSPFDGLLAAAAARRLDVLPVVQLTPLWASGRPGVLAPPPSDPASFGRFMSALVARYGPRGAFWREHPDLPRSPIRAWQLWNEPQLDYFWADQPFATSFVPVLRAGARAVRAADPGATVVLAGLTAASWDELESVYAAGGRGAFDAVALHPYTRRPRDVIRTIELVRGVMRAHGDGALPVWVTELSWPAALGRAPGFGIEVDEAGQAQRLRAALRLLRAARERLGIARVYWYTWLSTEAGERVFDWSGLRRQRGGVRVGTAALAVFRRIARRLEGCAKRAADARACA